MLQAGELNKLKVNCESEPNTKEHAGPVPAGRNLTLLDPEICDIPTTPADDIDCLSSITMRAPIPPLVLSTTLYVKIENFRIYYNMIVIYFTVQLMQYSHILPVPPTISQIREHAKKLQNY